jgi:phosphohistidine phosphatase
MKRISLLRHTEAAARTAALTDFERPITAQGREDAAAMGAYLAKSKTHPDAALCSGATRTRETLDCVRARLPKAPQEIFSDALYNAAPEQLLTIIKDLPDRFSHVLLVGHNPGLHRLALALIAAPEDGGAEKLAKFPKGALAQFEWDADAWSDISLAGGRLISFATPKTVRR